MKSIRVLLAATACSALSTPALAQSFDNNWSFVDQTTGQTVGGVVSGLVNGTNVSADGLTITVTQSPYASLLGTYAFNFGGGAGYPSHQDSYSAVNGVVTFANFLYSDEGTGFIRLATVPNSGGNWPDLISYATMDNVYNRQSGVTFSAITSGVPEPATWAMMILGFVCVGGAMRRRGQQQPRVRYDFA